MPGGALRQPGAPPPTQAPIPGQKRPVVMVESEKLREGRGGKKQKKETAETLREEMYYLAHPEQRPPPGAPDHIVGMGASAMQVEQTKKRRYKAKSKK